ncbi:hypothetical protein PFISCL1PPCAC_9227, partial [Pristionchus fissidentatus]
KYLTMKDRGRLFQTNHRIYAIEQNAGGRKFHEVKVFWISHSRMIAVKVKIQKDTGDIEFRETFFKEGRDFTNESNEKLAIYFYNASTHTLSTMCKDSARVNPMLSM